MSEYQRLKQQRDLLYKQNIAVYQSKEPYQILEVLEECTHTTFKGYYYCHYEEMIRINKMTSQQLALYDAYIELFL